MGDLFIGLAALITALASSFVLVWNTVTSGRKSKEVAKSAAEESAATVADAIADGKLTSDEVKRIRRALDKQQREGGDVS